MLLEILVNNETESDYFINDIQNLGLPITFNNYGKIKIRATDNYLLVLFNTFDQIYIYKFCDYMSYSNSF